MTFQTTRPQPYLHLPTKQRLQRPKIRPTLNPSAQPAFIAMRPVSASTSTSTPVNPTSSGQAEPQGPQGPDSRDRRQTTEVDIAGTVQPFLDPSGWENIRRVGQLRTGEEMGLVGRREREEEERKKREREAEFGEMAVRGRMGRWKRS
ncbi:uncharacterized protein ATNIH1004_006036 [Aspergillus tanneri]|uniref:Uncharacterized protein n=1 Tax=Aspergillus tanneri TaxID=1220188 RepID=A0A5M9MPK0_9EURO|nr:uncharacterized protein ATNIH1004_006036 [Aspergillus tanneri]KAA8647344.1 hypothetical protein ATNIH1004_006036 [Aspergillus tanneri]